MKRWGKPAALQDGGGGLLMDGDILAFVVFFSVLIGIRLFLRHTMDNRTDNEKMA